MKTKFILSIIPLLILLMAGCSKPASTPDIPDESLGQKALEENVQAQSKGQIKVVRFTKTNATTGPGLYNMEYEAVIEFLADGAWTRGGSFDPNVTTFGFSPRRINTNPESFDGIVGMINNIKNVRQGQQETVTGTILFQKAENGWRKAD